MQTYNELQQENDTLRALIAQLQQDHTFGILNKSGLHMLWSNIEDGKDLIYIDLCNVHAANHAYTFSGYDSKINKVLDAFRSSDIIAKIGGDELIVILNSGNAVEYCERLAQVMKENDIYAVIAPVKTSNGLQATIDKADADVSGLKLALEMYGLKPSRDEAYKCLDSYIIVEK
jgi:GGDEF domain-containing protein